MCGKLQIENTKYAKLPHLIQNLKPLYQKQRKCMLGHHRRTSSSQYNSSILGNDDLGRTMAEFDIHFKELEKEASSFSSQKEKASHDKENELEVQNAVCKLDSNVYSMKKIFDSISHLLDDEEVSTENSSNKSSQGKKKHVKNRVSLQAVETKTIDFRPFLTTS